MKFSINDNIPLSIKKENANHIFLRRQKESAQKEILVHERNIHVGIEDMMSWDPHVHALQEMVPLKINVNSILTDWQVLTSNSGLSTGRTSKIGCRKINNTLSIKIRELKKVDTNDTKLIIITYREIKVVFLYINN